MIEKLELVRVYYMPRQLDPGFLYYSEEFAVAAHLCPCGCGNKVVTPIGPSEWSFTEGENGASLFPSIGNWEIPCRTHYWIRDGHIVTSGQWNDRQIAAGRKKEEKSRTQYYQAKNLRETKRKPFLELLDWIFFRLKGLFQSCRKMK